jgi:hypothetical protein
MTRTVKPYRVACADYATDPLRSYDGALRLMQDIEKQDACHAEHRVEVLVDGEWRPTEGAQES